MALEAPDEGLQIWEFPKPATPHPAGHRALEKRPSLGGLLPATYFQWEKEELMAFRTRNYS